MAQFSVHENPNPRTKGDIPFLLDVQSDLFSVLATRFVVPLYRPEAVNSKAMTRLTPILGFQDRSLIAMVPEMAGIHQRDLGVVAGEVPQCRPEILQAVDLLMTGF